MDNKTVPADVPTFVNGNSFKKMARFSTAENLMVLRALILRLQDVNMVVRGVKKELPEIACYLATQLPNRSYATLKAKISKILKPLKQESNKSMLTLSFIKDSLISALLGKETLETETRWSKRFLYADDTEDTLGWLGKREQPTFSSAEDEISPHCRFRQKGKPQIAQFSCCFEQHEQEQEAESTNASPLLSGQDPVKRSPENISIEELTNPYHTGQFNQDFEGFASIKEGSLGTGNLLQSLDTFGFHDRQSPTGSFDRYSFGCQETSTAVFYNSCSTPDFF